MNFDNVKRVNDTFGSPAGDNILAMMAERMRAHAAAAKRPHAARHRTGTDGRAHWRYEFVVILDGMRSPAGVRRVAQHLLEEIGKPYRIVC